MAKLALGGGTHVHCAATFPARPRASTRRVPPRQINHAHPRHIGSARRTPHETPSNASRSCTVFATTGEVPAPETAGGSIPPDFDVALAAALGGAAFHAYLDPEQTCVDPEAEDLFLTSRDDGTNVTYLNRKLLPPEYDGMLEVELKSASGLGGGDYWSKSDPFVVLTVANSKAQSTGRSNVNNPEWNENFKLLVRDTDQDVLRLQVMDDDRLSQDDPLGFAEIPVNSLTQKNKQDLTLELQGEGGGGTVTLSVKYISFKDNGNADGQAADTPKRIVANPDIPPKWQRLALVAGRALEVMFTPVCFIENKGCETQAWVHLSDLDSNRKEVVVSFRGTETVEWKDLVVDALVLLTDVDENVVSGLEAQGFTKPGESLKVHRGFSIAYDGVRDAVADIVDAITGGSSDWKVYATGHSLGGALATLCSLHLASRECLSGRVEMYNFGSPRVGTTGFAAAYNAAVPKGWRLRNTNDLVAGIPFLMGYNHVGEEVILERDGTLKFCGREEDGVEGASVLGMVSEMLDDAVDEVAEDVMDGSLSMGSVRGIIRSATDVVDPMLDEQAKLLADLIDGSGLEDHSEDVYLDTMTSCVEKEVKK